MGPIQIFPHAARSHLEAIIAAQACYYGQHNAHVVFWLYHALGLPSPVYGRDF